MALEISHGRPQYVRKTNMNTFVEDLFSKLKKRTLSGERKRETQKW